MKKVDEGVGNLQSGAYRLFLGERSLDAVRMNTVIPYSYTIVGASVDIF